MYPKQRPPLPPEYAAIYAQHYADNRRGTGAANSLAQRLEGWMHRQVAGRSMPGQKLLDFGAGNLNQVPYESSWAVYDAVEPFRALYEGLPALSSISQIYDRVQDIPTANRYDRIFSIAVLEHVDNLPAEIAACARLLAPGGLFQAAIPCEGELAWTLGWKLTTAIAFRRKYGLDYGVIMRHEHLNTFAEIVGAIRDRFANVTVRRSPFPLGVPHGSFYAYVEASRPRDL